MDLQAFGYKLQELRQKAGLTQKQLAGQVFVSVDLLSKWERARKHQGRHWQPDLQSVLRLVKLFAHYLTPGEAQTWAIWAGHNLSTSQLAEIFGAVPHQVPPLPPFYIHRTELEQALLEKFSLEQTHTLVLLGIGGAGKSTLAAWLAQSMAIDFPDGIIWIEQQGCLDFGRAQVWIARSFGTVLDEGSLAEQAAQLRSLLHGKRCLLILDDVWASSDLRHLLLCSSPSRMLITTRDAKVADILHVPFIRVAELTESQGLDLLTKWVGRTIPAAELVNLLAGHALALSLSGAQLRAGVTLSDLLAALQSQYGNLSILDLVEAEDRAESVIRCFDLSYDRLSPEQQQYFAQLSCFNGKFQLEAAAAVWAITSELAQDQLRQLVRLALLQSDHSASYHLHPLLHAYARQKLLTRLAELRSAWRRYAIWHIRYVLYHPAVLDDVTDPAPSLDSIWPDIIAAVRWVAVCDPPLATLAALLAYTERPALVARLGLELIEAISRHVEQVQCGPELAILSELLGELHLLHNNMTDSLSCFQIASR
ncbi:MAG: NB-ARC domain-containing protein [Anaerolineae bacterium]